MMNYEIFKEVVAEKFMDYMPEEMQGFKMNVHPVTKVNVTLDGITVMDQNKESGIAPTIYINDMYEQYVKSEDLEGTLNMAAFNLASLMNDERITMPNLDMDTAKDNIVFQLVNTEQNKEMLANMPNRSFQDLSIIYRWVVRVGEQGIESTVVNNNLAKQLGLSEDALFKAAVENTRRILPPTVKSMNDVIRDMFLKDGMPEEMAEMMLGEIPPDQMMYVISNEQGINGAVSMMYEDKLHNLAEQLETDLYIMPSSVHEVIAVSANMGDPNELAAMVAEINMDQVALNERLSNQVYHYDKDLRKLTLATDTPNKRLDGIVAEPKLIYNENKSR